MRGDETPPPQPAVARTRGGTRGGRGGSGWFLLGLTACHAVNDLYGLVLPPLLPAIQAAFALSYLQLGMLSFATTAISAFAQPLVGYWADLRRRRRLVLVAGFCLFPVAMVLIGNAPSYGALLAAAAVLGLASSAYHPQSTTLLLARFPVNRGWASGIHGIGNSIGFALAPVLVGPLAARFGWRPAALALALPALAAAALSWWLVKEPSVRVARGLRAGVSRPLLVLTCVNGIQGAVVAGFVTFLPAYYANRGAGLALAGLLTAPTLAAGLFAQPLGGTLSDRLGRRGVLIVATVALGVSLLFFPRVDGVLLIALAVLIGFWASLAPPVVLVYAAELAPGGRTGQAVGLAWGAGIAISSIAAPATGAAIDAFGFAPAHTALGFLALAAAVLALSLPRRET
ncbi:MAG: MFS transporter [Chloroflexi bacterium]|nr:MFS transporter [Chloroflexota bacterium]